MKHLVFSILLSFLAIAAHLCAEEKRPDTWPLQIGNTLFMRMELAISNEEQRTGLMNRLSMPSDAGMLFVSSAERQMSFWMKNTMIPLDILFLDSKGEVVAIHQMPVERPIRQGEDEQLYEMTLTQYPSGKPAQFAIEINAGQAEKCGVKVGDIIDIRWPELKKFLP